MRWGSSPCDDAINAYIIMFMTITPTSSINVFYSFFTHLSFGPFLPWRPSTPTPFMAD